MAKGKRGTGKSAAAEQEKASQAAAAAAGQKTLVLISAQALKALLREDDKYKDQIDGLTGELRETIGNAVEKKHLHKKAYADLKRFSRCKSNEQLAEWWNTLLAYMDMAGVMARIESVDALPLDGEGETDGAGETDGEREVEQPADDTKGTVARPQFGGRAAH